MGAAPISEKQHISLAVCICTYQRPAGLKRLLHALELQQFTGQPPAIDIVIVDNSSTGETAKAQLHRQGRWPLHYRHEPRPGISHARNTAIAAVPVNTEFIAMIDDDEEPEPQWLAQLLNAQAATNADIVVGPTLPRFPAGTASWIIALDYFAKPQNHTALKTLDPNPPAATCNVLLRAELFSNNLRFDPEFALSGGEDKLLFQHLKLRGYRFAWACNARVIEHIPAERASLAYMCREAYRRGSIKYLVKRRLKSRTRLKRVSIALRLLTRSALRTLRDTLFLLLSLPAGRARWAPYLLSIADSLGTSAGVLGIKNRHYRPEGAL